MEYISYRNNSIIEMLRENMKIWLKQYGLLALGLLAGAAGGYLYWRYVGCSTGSCPIAASPWGSTVWGAAIGGLLLSTFKKEKKYD